MVKLQKIKIVNATAKDLAVALNVAMQKSPKTAQKLSSQLKLKGSINENHVIKNLYPKDTFVKEGKITKKRGLELSEIISKLVEHDKKLEEYNLMDYVYGIIKFFSKES